ncbi:hypothetical protein ACHAWF_007469 [Thalassiosira exigua]
MMANRFLRIGRRLNPPSSGSSATRSSSAVADAAAGAPPQARPKPPSGVYMWGTSKKGTIPIPLLREAGEAASATSGGIFSSGDEKILDHPMRLNLEDESLRAFLFGEEGSRSEENANVSLEKVFCGATGTAMLLDDGRCFVMGSNKHGQLGMGSSTKESIKPIHLPLPDPVAKASLGPNFSALLTTTGDLYTFGYGGSRIYGMGCLGHGNMDSHPTPTVVQSLIEDGCYASDVHCGEYSMTVLTTEGEVLTCGRFHARHCSRSFAAC